jgi:uncharacterized secreted protein with C-terminal beta-propeller domain
MRKLLTSIAIASVLLSACGREAPGGAGSTGSRDPNARTSGRAAIRAASTAYSLERFDSCEPLLEHLRSEALKRVGPWGLPGFGGDRAVALESATTARGAADSDSAAGAAAPEAHSTTNIQERGVDEPDVVKTDGRHMFTVRPAPGSDEGRQVLTSIAIEDGTPAVADDVMLPEGGGYELLLAGDRMLAMGQRGGYGIAVDMDQRMGAPGIAPQETGTVIAIVDVSDRANMRITNKLELDGSYVSARMIDGVARLVLNSQSQHIPFEQPTEFTVEGQRKTLEENKAKIRKATIEDWLPRFTLEDADGSVTSEGTLATCDSTFHPKTFSGFGEMSVVTIDPAKPDPRDSATVLGAAGTVYASTSNLYVATQEWPQAQPLVLSDRPAGAPETIQPPAKSALHRFEITDPLRAVYAASGEVRGIVLNQWSMSEHEGYLRVATTEDRFSNNEAPSSSSFVTVLDARAAKLDRVAGINDISPGERIYGVRFMGDTGYVVTFKQIDPLHVVDLSNPREPRLRGELKIPGYSAYLHPVGEGLLLGVGRDADLEGRPLGVSVSLFDVNDPAAPKRLDVERLNDTYTQVEYDHHAFTWWEPKQLALFPVELQNVGGVVSPDGRETAPDKASPTSYLYSFRVESGGLTKVARLTHAEHTQQYTGQITRSIVVGDTLFSLSGAGVAASNLDTLAERGWLALS